jgi:hypothetical protein
MIVALYYLWSIAWAAQNAHLRARETVLHGCAYLKSNCESGSTPFGTNNYNKADSTSFNFSATSTDESIPGFSESGESISVTATITSD